MIDALKRTLVAVKDLSQQGDSKYILVAGAGGTRYYAIDRYKVDAGIVEFFRGTTCVFVCKADGVWSLVDRSTVDLVSEEEVLRSSKSDHDALEKLHGELHPTDKPDVERPDPGMYL